MSDGDWKELEMKRRVPFVWVSPPKVNNKVLIKCDFFLRVMEKVSENMYVKVLDILIVFKEIALSIAHGERY